jgi:hypothetical protein
MNIKIMGNFKTGTSSLENILLKSLDDKYNLLKGKHANIFTDVDILIIPIRKHYEIFISAFFQDITKTDYRYFYNSDKDIILKDDVNNLIKFFLNIKWENEKHLCFSYILEHLHKIFEINENINMVNKDYLVKEFCYKNSNKKIKIIFIKYIYLDIENIKKIFSNLLGLDIKIPIKLYHSNNGEQKWYSKKYIEFKNEMQNNIKFKNEYFNKYKYLDNDLF